MYVPFVECAWGCFSPPCMLLCQPGGGSRICGEATNKRDFYPSKAPVSLTIVPPSRHLTSTIIPHGIMRDRSNPSLGPLYKPTTLVVKRVLPYPGLIMDKTSRSLRARRIHEDTWELWREDLIRLYLEHGMMRRDIVKKMAGEHQFVVT